MPFYAFTYPGLKGWCLATVKPTPENCYLSTLGVDPADMQVYELSFQPGWDDVQCCWVWRRTPDPRPLRGRYVHAHKGKHRRSHPMPQRPPSPTGWAIGHIRPRYSPAYQIRPLYFL